MPSGSSSLAKAPAAARGRRPKPHAIERLDRLAHLMDSRFEVPGTEWRFGLDSLIGLIPGVGDAATAAVSAYLIAEAHRLGARRRAVSKMVGVMLVDMLVGAIPLAGDLFDVFWKANRRNMAIARKDIEHQLSRDA